ncbi:type I DNA topoisomerase [Candidatus Comchoanobacter bicostacola]|uniref:DNA topoisomerase 1 n=1 Tax=Candidatus Comchoanobacter bicostacola TaxID=2919598 RepID=A0ABY5DL82_9GAMM|nr:type I DNA topoisomerase [Candidatus Comchoanobacter bicostacola]UTC24728.1 type I DNA topoisomerase [Candidatus Comchoanobacter bicostacola]
MSEHKLVIVESPTKAKTIQKFLGKDYTILATYGHIYELIKKNNAIDTEHGFKMHYQVVDKNKKHVDNITKSAAKCSQLILATDPDREGEAIAWHVCEHLKSKKKYEHLTVHRCTFHQITKKAILESIANPQSINMDLVDAQQTRRAMDFLLGYNISPLMWRTIKPGTSAGRVQSPALSLIVRREQERNAFESQEYWKVTAKTSEMALALSAIGDNKLDKFSIQNQEEAEKIVSGALAAKSAILANIESKARQRNPKPPFTTSTMQQEAATRINFPTAKTMKVAQELYEGVNIDGTQTGLITYMRTDSVSLSKEAISDIRTMITQNFSPKHLPDEPRLYKTKTKNAQEAHEAIRPSDANLTPEYLKQFLSPDQLKLYQLIWSRAVSSQMVAAKINTTTYFVEVDEYLFKTSGSTIEFPGFLDAYADHDHTQTILPRLSEGDTLNITAITPSQHFTEPPARFTEASIVKTLEELGIGRPSTYATIISTLKKRAYVEMENKQFAPTDIADVINKFLTLYFTDYIDYQFTAKMEDGLDDISRGDGNKEQLLQAFWTDLHGTVERVSKTVKRSDVAHEQLDEKCPECDKNLVLKLGRHGKFIGCSGYPECGYTRPLEDTPQAEPEIVDKKCPKCSSDLVKKHGPTGDFYGCSSYPECKHIEPLPENITDVDCPKCNKNKIIKRKSKRGKIFYSCMGYPKCKYAIWNPPLKKSCPKCKWPIMTEKTLKSGTTVICPECGHKDGDDID